MSLSHNESSSAKAFARRFRLLMSYHDLTLRDIADATRSAVSTVGTWRNGRIPSSRPVLESLAAVFHVSVEYLLTGQITQQPSSPGDKAASRLLIELDLLARALEDDQSSLPPDNSDKMLEEDAPAIPYGADTVNSCHRQQIEHYLETYLDRAALEPGGLAHAWVQLRREFPLDLYERLRR